MKSNLKNKNKLTIVFTGPSLPAEEARQILPEACYHEPIQCGDVIKAMRAGAERIVIIDGYFEQRGAVWHKEIVFALSQGIEVYGASSMGALRAAELHTLGMVGFGKIFECYRDNQTLDDDEVALVHAARFDSHITPMVNIRPTLDKAVLENKISKELSENLLTQLKNTPYYNRSLFNASSDPELNSWFLENYIDQKKLDAKGLLQSLNDQNNSSAQNLGRIQDSPLQKIIPEQINLNTNAVFFNRIFREIIVEPFDQPYPWLSDLEKSHIANQKKSYFQTTQRIAKCLHLGLDIAIFNKNLIDQNNSQDSKKDPKEAYQELLRLQKVSPIQPELLLTSLMIESGFPINLQDSRENPEENPEENFQPFLSALNVLSQILAGVIGFMTQQNISISARSAQTYANEFRRARQLNTAAETLIWMKKHGLDNQSDFEKLIMSLCPLHHIIDLHNAHSIGLNTTLACHNWLAEAEFLVLTEISKTPIEQQ